MGYPKAKAQDLKVAAMRVEAEGGKAARVEAKGVGSRFRTAVFPEREGPRRNRALTPFAGACQPSGNRKDSPARQPTVLRQSVRRGQSPISTKFGVLRKCCCPESGSDPIERAPIEPAPIEHVLVERIPRERDPADHSFCYPLHHANLTRGSTWKYSRSTMALITTNSSAISIR